MLLAKNQRRSRVSKEKSCRIKKRTGKIKTLRDKGFGFIAREGEVKDLFFHSNDVVGVTFDELKEGDTVNFEVVDGEKGPSAKNVERI